MDNDLYVDCPSCGHTVKVANDLIGAMVECPDCSFDFEVPDIREGLNPRFRNVEENAFGPDPDPVPDPVPDSEYDFPDLGNLHTGLKSLLRRQRAQVEQIDLLNENTDLLLKQVHMLTPGRFPNTVEGKISRTGAEEADPVWFRWSLICGCISIVAALIVVVVLFL